MKIYLGSKMKKFAQENHLKIRRNENSFSMVEFFGVTDLAKPTRLFVASNSVYHAPIKTSPRIQRGPAGGGISIPAKPDRHVV